MPLYEYQCDSCGARFERIQKFSDPPVSECPTCGGPVRKLISSPAIQFKGTGFYITDYAKSGSKGGDSDKAAKSDKSESKPSSDTAAPAAKSDAPASSDKAEKPAASTESKKTTP